MIMTYKLRASLTFVLVSQLLWMIPAADARGDLGPRAEPRVQKGDKDAKSKESGKKEKQKADKKTDEVEAKPKLTRDEGRDLRNVMWQEQADIAGLDLYYGPGGREGSPETATKFTFVSRDPKGTSEKIIVEDDKGRKWTVKFGPEARPETAATRLAWAAGYHTDWDYLVKQAHIEGRGGFDVWDVRFKSHDDGFKHTGYWSWEANPFMGTRDLQGMKVLMALLNNWDLKWDNNKIAAPRKKSGGDTNERVYYIADLGATFGATGSFFHFLPNAPAGSKDQPDAYAKQQFIAGVRDGQVEFNYKGKDPGALKGVTVENARWIGNLLGRLSDKQLSDAFRAADYNDAEVTTLVRSVRSRINELQNLK